MNAGKHRFFFLPSALSSRIAWLFGCSSKQATCFFTLPTLFLFSHYTMDYHHYEQQQQLDTPLIFNITTVDYNRKDPVFWIETIVSRPFIPWQ